SRVRIIIDPCGRMTGDDHSVVRCGRGRGGWQDDVGRIGPGKDAVGSFNGELYRTFVPEAGFVSSHDGERNLARRVGSSGEYAGAVSRVDEGKPGGGILQGE